MAQENIKKENKKELEELKQKCEEYLLGWKRERADFLNYKKDESERISSFVKFANEEIIFKLLPVLDNLLLAQIHINDEGLSQVIKQFEDFLKQEGIEPVKSIGEKFDPNTMEAVGADEGSAEGAEQGRSTVESDTVIDELQRGYTLHGKVIRPAKVRIAK